MVTGNQTHIDPAAYFAPDAYVPEQPLLSKYFYPVCTPIFGVGLIAFSNLLSRRPVYSGIQLHVLAASTGLMLGIYIEKTIQKNCIKRDSLFYSYIKSHPEDFPPIERVKFKDVLEIWTPCRAGR